MNVVTKAIWMGISVIFSAGMVACDKPGPAESVGSAIDETTEKAARSIDAATKKLTEQSEKVGGIVNDAAITAKVKAAILAETKLRSLPISVTTTNDHVTLSGIVDSQQSIDRAKEIASSVSGVKKVENLLLVKSTD